jgi:uncharacterized membrane protein YidH (DUF202 family)
MSARASDGDHDEGLQPERTALAWERTAIAMLVAGVLMTRAALELSPEWAAIVGMCQVVFGSGLFLWAGRRSSIQVDDEAGGRGLVHPRAAQIVGIATVAFCACGSGVVLATVLA